MKSKNSFSKNQSDNVLLESELQRAILKNKQLQININEIDEQIDQYQAQIQELKRDEKYYQKEHEKILSSRSWKVTAPMRTLGSFVKTFKR